MWHITQAKRKLRLRLFDALPSKLVEADGSAADGISTPAPAVIYTTAKADMDALPALVLIVTDSTPSPDATAQLYRHRMVVGVTIGGDDEERITSQIERYIWAIRQVCRDLYVTPIEGTVAVDTGGEQYTPLVQSPTTAENPFVQGAFIELFVTTIE